MNCPNFYDQRMIGTGLLWRHTADVPRYGGEFTGRIVMRWSKPKIREIAVGLEINSYACASLA
jgi:coenzyme PQQ precursor peptide PqqA